MCTDVPLVCGFAPTDFPYEAVAVPEPYTVFQVGRGEVGGRGVRR